jgi:hypothetical protein
MEYSTDDLDLASSTEYTPGNITMIVVRVLVGLSTAHGTHLWQMIAGAYTNLCFSVVHRLNFAVPDVKSSDGLSTAISQSDVLLSCAPP